MENRKNIAAFPHFQNRTLLGRYVLKAKSTVGWRRNLTGTGVRNCRDHLSWMGHWMALPRTKENIAFAKTTLFRFEVVNVDRGQKLNTYFFLKLFGHFRDIPAKSRDIPPKSLISLASRDISNFLAPTPSCKRPPPHRKISDSKVWVCALRA